MLEGKDAAKAPTMHKTALHSKTYPVQNVYSAKNEKLVQEHCHQGLRLPVTSKALQALFGNCWIWTTKVGRRYWQCWLLCGPGLLRKIIPGISLLLYLCSSYPPYLRICALATAAYANPTQPCELLWGHDLQEVIPGFSCSESSLQRK